jgi:hypothetical protein
MINIKIKKNIFKIESNRKYEKFENKENSIIYFFKYGYESFSLKKNQEFKINEFKEIKDFFQQNNFIDTLIIFKNNKLCIANSIDSQRFYIFKSEHEFILSTDQFYLKRKADFESIYLSLNTRYNFWLSRGINDVDNVIPGSINLFDIKENYKILKKDLIFNFQEIGSNSQHDQIVRNIIDKFDIAFKELKKVKDHWELLLSSGLDSAIYLLFAINNNLQISCNSFDVDNPEIISASRFTKYFNFKQHKYVRGGISYNEKFNIDTDLSRYLEFVKPIIENNFNVMFLLNMIVDFAYYKKQKNNFILEGSEYPRALCIEHLTSYPNYFSSGINKFKPEINKEKRLKIFENYKHNFESALINKKDLSQFFKDVDERYYHTLSKVFYGTHSVDLLKGFIINKKFLNNNEILHNSIIKNSKPIISMLNDIGVMNHLRNFSERKNIMLQKIIRLISGTARSSTDRNEINDTGLLHHFRPATNSSIVNELLKTSYDEKLIDYPKWHLFEVFKRVSGFDFFSLNYKSLFVKEFLKKNMNIIKNKKHNPKRLLFYNKSFRKFIKKNYGKELLYVLNYLKLKNDIDKFFDSKLHFMTFSKIINLAGLIKNDKIEL